uniref:Doublecortin domain-containing protein n=1 Tax=Strongyloides papillosus TaxID=174720 RepID=A0A0N5CD20_STREA
MKLYIFIYITIIIQFFTAVKAIKQIRVRYPTENKIIDNKINEDENNGMKKEKFIVNPNIPFLMKPLRFIKTSQLSAPHNFGFMYRREGVKYFPTNIAEVTGRLTRKASRSQYLKFDADGRHVIFNRPYGSKTI